MNRFSKFVEPELPRDQRRSSSACPSGLNAADATNRIGISAKMIAPMATRWRQPTAHEPVLAGHRLISSRAAVRRNPMIETVATITKMRTETAAANPYWAPPSANASR